MTTSEHRIPVASRLKLSGRARGISFGEDTLSIELEDGRQLAVPIAWFPRLAAAGDEQRSRWELVGQGIGISWPEIDEDISVANLLQADGELLMASDLDMGMTELARKMVTGWVGTDEDLITKLCQGGWFANQEDAKVWLAKLRETTATAQSG